tara:strand:- start:926 stop:1186 length:261 start_codon:yes stop_codon:yes gene_type:complete
MVLTIFIESRSGFGNKMFDLVLAIYLKRKYKVRVGLLINKSLHEKKNDPGFEYILNRAKEKIDFFTDLEFKMFKTNNKIVKIDKKK